jgi:hypothetical protein
MRKTLLMLVCVLGIGLLLAGNASATTLNYASVSGAEIEFPGDTKIKFPNSGTYDFEITSSDPSGSSAVGFFGNITEPGTGFTIGVIDVSGTTAPVTGKGTFTIDDGTNTLTADLTWEKISQVGSGGSLNFEAKANLTNIQYAGLGLDPDLVALRDAGGGINVLSFQFTSTYTLSELKDGATPPVPLTSYSGSVTPVPVPGALLLLGAGLLRLATYGRRRRHQL